MPKYRVKELSLIGNELFQAGAEVEYDGLPAENLEPLCDEGRAKYQEYLDSNAARVRQMKIENDTSSVGDPAAFMAALIKSQEDNAAKQAEQIGAAVAQAIAALFPNGVPVKAVRLPDAPAADPLV